ncbi:Fc.00g010640.m01.CDS01 [Cosmosporella sp. VM-42]
MSNDSDIGIFFARLERSLYQPSWPEAHRASQFKEMIDAVKKSEVYHNILTTTYVDSSGNEIVSITQKNGQGVCENFFYDLNGNHTEHWDSIKDLL